MEQILVKELVEYNFNELFLNAGDSLVEELETKSDELKRLLGLRIQPIQIYKRANKKKIKFSGVAGVISLKLIEIEVMPKFLKEASTWRESLFNMIYWSKSGRLFSQKSSHIVNAHFSFYDHVSLMFFNAMNIALSSDRIHTYYSVEDNSRYLKGRMLISKQLQNIIAHPGILYYECDSFDTDNEFNYLLNWCLKTLYQKTRNAQIKLKLRSLFVLMSDVSRNYKIPVDTKLPPQYSDYQEAIDIANNLALGYSYVHTSKNGNGIGYVVNTEVVYEKFVEKILQELKASTYTLKSEAQSSKLFAKGISANTSSYYTVPDNKVFKNNRPQLLVDAKYKNIYSDEKKKKPVNSDIYQLFCSLITHDCDKGILISPCESEEPIAEHSWEVFDNSKKYELFSITVDMSDLSTPMHIEELKKRLLAYLDLKMV